MDPYRTIMRTEKKSGFSGRYSRADMARARANIGRHEWARRIFGAFQEAADGWAVRDDQELYDLVPPDNPRALAPGFENGCPLHGGSREAFATSLETPYRFQCQYGGEWWYNGAEITNPGTGEVVLVYDFGPGWVAPRGFPRAHDIYYFTAAYREFLLGSLFSHPYPRILPGSAVRPCILPLGVMYALTGEKRYAHKAAVLIHRLADCFPKYDGCSIQYAAGWSAKDRRGLVPAPHSRCIGIGDFSTGNDAVAIQNVATTYDFIFDTLAGDRDLLDFLGAHDAGYRGDGEATRIHTIRWEDVAFHVHHRLFGAAMDWAQRIIDNSWGADWIQDCLKALACLARVMGNDAMVRDVIERPNGYLEQFTNFTWRDGKHWYNNAGYAHIALHAYCVMAEWLHGYAGPYSGGKPLDLYRDPRFGFHRMFDWAFDWAFDGVIPCLGDSGGGGRAALSGSAAKERDVYGDPGDAVLYGALRVPEYRDHCLRALSRRSQDGLEDALGRMGATLHGLWALVHLGDLPTRESAVPPPPRSRIFHDMGVAYFHTSGDTRSDRTHFTFKPLKGAPSHAHHEQLAVGIVRGGYDLTADPGYPAAWTSPKVAGWLNDTLSHNTVYLGGRTHGLTSGGLRFGYTGPEVHVAAGEAERQVHPDCSLYRRVFAVVDLGPGRCYAADFFRVSGSLRREYVFHGLGGEEGRYFSLRGMDGPMDLGPREPGTLAGPEVPYGAEPGYGFLKDGTHCPYDGALIADWQAEGPDTAGLRLHLMGGPKRELITARGEGPGVLGMSPWDTYLLVRVEPEAGADTLFAGVMEPYGPQAHVDEVSAVSLGVEPFEAAGLRVASGDRVDYFFSCLDGGTLREAELPEGLLRFDGEFAWIAFRNGRALDGMLINGVTLRCGAFSLSGPGLARGVVEAVDREAPALTVHWETPVPAELPGPVLVVDGDGYSITSSYEAGPIEPLPGDRTLIQVREPGLLEIGRATIERMDGRRLHLAQMLTKGTIRGLYDRKPIYGDRGGCGLVETADELRILLAEGAGSFSVGESVIIDDVKVGDRVTVPGVARYRASNTRR